MVDVQYVCVSMCVCVILLKNVVDVLRFLLLIMLYAIKQTHSFSSLEHYTQHDVCLYFPLFQSLYTSISIILSAALIFVYPFSQIFMYIFSCIQMYVGIRAYEKPSWSGSEFDESI